MCLKLQFSATIIHQRPRINQIFVLCSASLCSTSADRLQAALNERCKSELKDPSDVWKLQTEKRSRVECAGAGGGKTVNNLFEDKHAEMRRTTQFKSSIVSLRFARFRVFSHFYDTARRRRVEIEQICQRPGGSQRAALTRAICRRTLSPWRENCAGGITVHN